MNAANAGNDGGAGNVSTSDEVSDPGRETGESGVEASATDAPPDGKSSTTDATDDRTVDADVLDPFRAAGGTIVTPDAQPREPPRGDRGRGQVLYDWWSDREWLYDGFMRLSASMRDETMDVLDCQRGETVLDLACGPGTNFEVLREAVGSSGTVVGLDYSPGMTRWAIDLVEERGWENVHVVEADATNTCGPDGTFDAIVTTFALHTVPDPAAALENVRDALAPGGRFVVLDSRPLTDGAGRVINPLYERLIAWMVNHQRSVDTLALLRDEFDRVRLVETYDGGAGYLAVAEAADTTQSG
ncbi:methylase involved in ubiquinone/menaquinone biosynthesis [Halovivax ruber XH-70]|uniref:Methylase involved in ubiquinone/menaquinone biosynthesis n=1 Tax=Halovivax ruber (strain DSM 18193 / JCM 13892 / XH-70) TaxID=797302 RepID=L0IB67_HALRX|nr:methyltransferase domain-containing protein [Halovivax ruber]AGB15999.1 methylase involved in ubiquinone/menaquinone biosynthesis [Halovivax ruber XH-70]